MATVSVPSAELHVVTFVGLKIQGQAPAPNVGFIIEVPSGELALESTAPVALRGDFRTIPVGELVGGSEALLTLVPQIRAPPAVSLSLTGVTPQRAFGLQLTGQAPLAVEETEDTVPRGSLEITGQTPSLARDLSAVVGSLSLTGNAPTVGTSVSPAVAGLLLASEAPDADTSALILAQAGQLAVSSDEVFTNVANSGLSIDNPNATQGPTNYEQCDYTGFRVLPGELVETGYGQWVRQKSFEPRHPQEFVRSVKERRKQGPQRAEQDDEFIEDIVTADDL